MYPENRIIILIICYYENNYVKENNTIIICILWDDLITICKPGHARHNT